MFIRHDEIALGRRLPTPWITPSKVLATCAFVIAPTLTAAATYETLLWLFAQTAVDACADTWCWV